MDSTPLTGKPLRTYQALQGNPSARNAPWSDIRALLEALADVTEEEGGNLTAIRNGHFLTLHPALTKDIAESGEVNALLHFLQASESAPAGATGRDPHVLLVIHGTDARLYRCQVIGGIPQLVLPYEAAVPNPEDRNARSVRRAAKVPSPDGVYGSTPEELQAAGDILIFDTGSGSDAAAFVTWLSEHVPELGERIIGTVPLGDLPRDPAGLLLAARRFYATPAPT
ncbi:MAG TPA: hypothetical protein VHE61_17965 [Opitutaceae bacterium]|nr:hypothetical protein [Opitutaceae bacterium]